MIKRREASHPKDTHLELNRNAENTINIAEIQVEEDHVKVFIQYFFFFSRTSSRRFFS